MENLVILFIFLMLLSGGETTQTSKTNQSCSIDISYKAAYGKHLGLGRTCEWSSRNARAL